MSETAAPSTVQRSWLKERLSLIWVILTTCMEERLTYRADFAFATLVRFLPIVTQIFLWGAIFSIESSQPISNLRGYSYGDMVSYYLLVMLSRAFSSMPGLASGIAADITNGAIKRYLIQPIDLLTYLFWHRVAHKLVYYFVAAIPFALVFWMCRGYFDNVPSSAEVWAAYVLSLLIGFLIGFLLESLIGFVAFWFLEVSSLLFVYMMLNYFLSGHMIPLDWLPESISLIIRYLPFQYLAYFPASIFLGKIPPDQLVTELSIAVGWVIVLYGANCLAYHRGIRRYSAYGG